MADTTTRGTPSKSYQLVGPDRRTYSSPLPGTFGGHRGSKIYGRLDCPAALRAIARGGYVKHRVFFADEQAAIAAGFRPCGACMPQQHHAWKTQAKAAL
jgi:Metal binding domain of Ada